MRDEKAPRPTILLVDDDPDVRAIVRAIIGETYTVIEAQDSSGAWTGFEEGDPDAVLLDLNLGPGSDGFTVLERMRAAEPNLPIVILSMYNDAATIVRAMRAGAVHYITKPPRHDELRERLRCALQERDRGFALEAQRMPGAAEIVGTSRAIRAVQELARSAAASDLPVLVLGETGTGKSLVARCIHEWGPRRRGPFRDVNVAGLATTVLDSELFGHERGAFTGADRRRRGLFELASGGTILLDEIGDLSHDSQIKLLKVIEDGVFRRVGGEAPLQTHARVLAATHQDLEAMMDAGTFRPDLFHRVAGIVISVPPLRERREDVPILARAFLGDGDAIDESAIEWLCEQTWPGNVRELLAALRRARLFARGSAITIDHLLIGNRAVQPFHGVNSHAVATAHGASHTADDEPLLPYDDAAHAALDAFRRDYVRRLLSKTNGNVAEAARASGLSRSHLHVIIRDLGL